MKNVNASVRNRPDIMVLVTGCQMHSRQTIVTGNQYDTAHSKINYATSTTS